jgi:hypothetical protein
MKALCWYGTNDVRIDTFPNEAGRQAHLAGKVAAALMAEASELFTQPPTIEKVNVLAAKLPREGSESGGGACAG